MTETDTEVDDLDLLRKVCESWVNGRKVIDGIPKTIADQVRARFQWETQPRVAQESCGCKRDVHGRVHHVAECQAYGR